MDTKYTVVLLQSDGTKLNITDLVQNLSYEESQNELAMRINLDIANEKYGTKPISSYTKLGCVILVYASCGEIKNEVARGTIVEWRANSAVQKALSLTCYDNLYYLQQSQDYIYYSKGVGTKAAITGILNKWKVPVGKYDGPNKKHGKLVYKTETVGEALLDILDDAYKKGDEKCMIQSSKGKISILKRGSNRDIYHFGTDNTIAVNNEMSTADMVTRVKVIGRESGDKKQSVDAVVDGKISFGIRQKIYTRSQDDSISAAKTAAKKILEEKGQVEKHPNINCVDVPWVRKGDRVHVEAGTLKGFYYVTGVRHQADSGTMSLELELWRDAPPDKKPPDKKPPKKPPGKDLPDKGGGCCPNNNPVDGSYKVGDIVILNGRVHRDSYGTGEGRNYKNYECKITIVADLTRKCPYHVNGIGWVKPGDIQRK